MFMRECVYVCMHVRVIVTGLLWRDCSNFVLDISEGFHEMGGVRWQLAGCLLLAWILVGGCLIKGIKSQGKVSTQTLVNIAQNHNILFLFKHLLPPKFPQVWTPLNTFTAAKMFPSLDST